MSENKANAPGSSGVSPQVRKLILAGVGVGVLLVVVCPCMGIGLAWIFSGGEKKTPIEKPPPEPWVKEKEKKKAEPPPPPPHIRQAIDKGMAHLKKQVAAGSVSAQWRDPLGGAYGVETGTYALAGLALIEGGASPQDPAVDKVLQQVRSNGSRVTHIYSLGAVLFFLNRMDQANALTDTDRRLQHTLTLQLVGGQCADGRWTYQNQPLQPNQEKDLVDNLTAKTYRPSKKPLGLGTSNSMTQFGLLALWGSRKRVPVRQPILHAAARFHVTQSSAGTWNYARPDMPSNLQDSNTCAGLLALAMEKALREDKSFRETAGTNDPPANPSADEQCRQAFDHLAKVIGRTRNDPPATPPSLIGTTGTIVRADAFGDYYFLWCLERVAVIYDLKTIGGKDWYGWGSDVILKSQKDDGRWVDRHGDVPDTCFAILFLTRANLAKDLTESIRARAGQPTP